MSIRAVTFPGPAGMLEGEESFPPTDPRASAVVAHPHPLHGGTMHNGVVRQIEASFLRHDTSVLRFNFRGVGTSGGDHDGGRGEVEDLRAAVKECLRRTAGSLPLLVAGYSFGAVMAVSAFADPHGEPPVPASLEGLLLLAPPVARYDLTFLKESSLPLAVLWGERDELTPRSVMRSLLDSCPRLVHAESIPEAAHDLGSMGMARTGLDPLAGSLDRAIETLLRDPNSSDA